MTNHWTMEMDAVGQLRAVLGAAGGMQSFVYDKGWNRVSQQAGSSVEQSSFNNVNQLLTRQAGGSVRVAGTVDKPSTVTVQGVPARVMDLTNFVATPNVMVGTNMIAIVATDANQNVRSNNYRVVVPEAETVTFSYDANGNLLSDGERTYEWDGLDRLIKVTKGTDTWEFGYDGLSRRVWEKKNGQVAKRYVWSGLQMVQERDGAGGIVREYLPQGEVGTGGAKRMYARDHLGSVREVVNDSGAVVASYSYDVWGRRTLLTGADITPVGFTGHYYHESGIVLAPFRAYDAETGRWISRDPIEEVGGINLYGYVGNDPANLIDPFGLKVIVMTRTFAGGLASHSWVEVIKSDGFIFRFSGTNEPKGKLGVLENYKNDVNPVNLAQSLIIHPPRGMTDHDWDNTVIESGRRELQKHLQREYDLLGGDGGKTSGNCHSVTSDIIEGAGGKISGFNPDGANPGLRSGRWR